MNNSQETRITATDDRALALKLGFNRWDEDRAQYVLDEDYDGNDPETDATAVSDREDPEGVAGPERGDQVGANGVSEDETDGTGDFAPYTEWSKEELSTEAARRGLPASGTKADLVSRLEADDTQES